MTLDRRRFLELTGLGTAAWITGGCSGSDDARPRAASEPAASAAAATLEITLWGSFLYAFGNNGGALEVSMLTQPASVPACTIVPHEPMLTVDEKTTEVVKAESTFDPGAGKLPPGVYRLEVQSESSRLTAEGLQQRVTDCPTNFNQLANLAFMPFLAARGSQVSRNWRDRFGTRVVFERGELRALRPRRERNRIAKWMVAGPGASGPHPFVDTFRLSVPLTTGKAIFVSDKNEKLTLAPAAGSSTIGVTLMAHPPQEGRELKKGDPEPHTCALYAAFDPVPQEADRARLIFEEWCPAPKDQEEPEVEPLTKGFSPLKYCTGAAVFVQ